jgi:hypothetical protein
MRRFRIRRPSPAMFVAVTALVIALGGTASAVTLTTAGNGDKLIKKHTLSGNRLIDHTLTKTQINVNKLGQVPSAKTADSVSGQTFTPISAVVSDGTTNTQVMDFAGVQILASCDANSQPAMNIFNVSNPAQEARINIETIGNGPTTYQTAGDFSGTALVGQSNSNSGTGEANIRFADGHVVTVWYSYEGNAPANGECAFYGHAMSG